MRNCVVLILLTISISLHAQKANDSLKKDIFRSKIVTLDDYITVKLTQSTDIEKLAVITPGTDILLSPNARSTTRISLSYRFLSVAYSFAPRFLEGNDDDALRGQTKINSLGTSFTFRHWIQDLGFSKTKGFYLENTEDFDSSWTPSKPYIQFPDLQFTQYYGSTAFNFNPDFSVNALTTQSERQIRSAGSFIPKLSYRYYISDDRSTPPPGGSTQKSNNFEIVLDAGYYYSLVLKEKFHFAIGAAPGVGYVFSKIATRAANETYYSRQTNFQVRIEGQAFAGYNGPRFFAGAYLRLINARFKQQHTQVVTEDDREIARVSVGYRLNAPKWLKKSVNAITEKLNVSRSNIGAEKHSELLPNGK